MRYSLFKRVDYFGQEHNPRMKAADRLLVIVDVNDGLLPLAGRDLALEHDVNLANGASLHLRDVEVCKDETDETSGTPDVTALAAQVDTLFSSLACCYTLGRWGSKLTVVLSM